MPKINLSNKSTSIYGLFQYFQYKHFLFQKYTDGGLSNNLPLLPNGPTITVSPFAGNQHICPNIKEKKSPVNSRKKLSFKFNKMRVDLKAKNLLRGKHAFFPPSHRQLTKYYERGVKDASSFLKQHGYWTDPQQPDKQTEEQTEPLCFETSL